MIIHELYLVCFPHICKLTVTQISNNQTTDTNTHHSTAVSTRWRQNRTLHHRLDRSND